MVLSLTVVAAFAALTLALAALWAPRSLVSSGAPRIWMVPGGAALLLALAGGLIDASGLLVLLAFGLVCLTARLATGPYVRAAAYALMLAIAAALFLHVIPGFDNPRVVSGAVLGPGAAPYTKYLNFDKGVAGLLLLGAHAPERAAGDEGPTHVLAFLWRFAILVIVAMVLALAFGYVRWDPKLPSWWAMWTWSMAFLTALPEEALFRGVVQSSLERWSGGAARFAGSDASASVRTHLVYRRQSFAVVTAALLFGIAHLAGGAASVVLATVAGIGYGWIYASTRSIAAAILAHAGLNTVHFLLFSYPSLLLPSR